MIKVKIKYNLFRKRNYKKNEITEINPDEFNEGDYEIIFDDKAKNDYENKMIKKYKTKTKK